MKGNSPCAARVPPTTGAGAAEAVDGLEADRGEGDGGDDGNIS